jgi:autotransporter-associated beta strand protein
MTFGNNSGYNGTLTINNGTAVSFNAVNAGSASAAWVFNDGNGGRVRVNVGNNTLSFGSLSGVGQFVNNTSSSTTVLSVGALNTDTTFAGTIKDNGTGLFALLKIGTGTLTLSGTNAYSAGTTISAGILAIGSGGTVGNLGSVGSTVTQNAGTTLSFTQTTAATNVAFANNLVLNGGTINAPSDGRYTLGSGTAGASGTNTIAVNGSTTFASNWGDKGFALGGILSGTGAITVQNTGGHNNHAAQVVFLNDNNTYSGTLTATGNYASGGAGAIVVGGNNALQFAKVVNNVVGGGTNGNGIIFNVTAPAFGSLAGSGNFILTSNTNVFNAATPNASGTAVALTVGGNNASTTYSGAISGVGSLAKTGTGVLTLSGTSTYTGATTIGGGTLNVTGALSGSGTLAVNSGGTLAGTGTVARAATVASGGAIAPGNNGAGTLTLSGGLTLNTGAVLNMELSGTTTSDKLAVSGAFSATGTTTINLTALGSFAGSGTYPLITGASGISAGNFAIGSVPAGYVCTLGVSGGTLSLTVMTQQESWRLANFGTTANSGNAADGADPDGDGLTNAQEFAAGTDPNSAASALRVGQIQPSGNDLVVSFATVAGKTYSVERSDTLQNGSWTTVQANIAGTGAVVQITDAGAAAQSRRFYRIVLLP